MKKIIGLLLALCVVCNIGNFTAFGFYSSDPVMYYYMKEYRRGNMKYGPGTLIGDPSFNNRIDAEDALCVLRFRYGQAHGPVLEKPITQEEIQRQEERCWRYLEGLSADYYKRGWHEYDWENKNWRAEIGSNYTTRAFFQRYTRNAYFLGDVSNDCQLGADDVLMILQYVVGKRDSFPRTDYTGKGNFQYMHPFEDWYPTKYADLRIGSNGRISPDAYDDVADIFPDIPPIEQ